MLGVSWEQCWSLTETSTENNIAEVSTGVLLGPVPGPVLDYVLGPVLRPILASILGPVLVLLGAV